MGFSAGRNDENNLTGALPPRVFVEDRELDELMDELDDIVFARPNLPLDEEYILQ